MTIKTVIISNKQYEYNTWWDGQIIPSEGIAFDTETEMIPEDSFEPPALALISVSNTKDNYLIHPSRISEFISLHAKKHYIFHNIPFDFWVIDKYLSENNHTESRLSWWNIIEENRSHDTLMLDMLVDLAIEDKLPIPRNLAIVGKIYANMDISKEDPYRIRYSELIGKNWNTEEIDPGFLEYAIKDPIVTYSVFCNLYRQAKQLAREAGVNRDTLEKFGPLTEQIQIKGAIALSKVTRNGIHIDLEYSGELFKKLRGTVENITGDILRNSEYNKIFNLDKQGKIQWSEKSGTPKRSTIVFREVLLEEVKKAEKADNIKIEVPLTEKGAISTSMTEWAELIKHSPFLQQYDKMMEAVNLSKFFRQLDKDIIHPRYTHFVRTGRISAYNPNITQMPKSGGFRESFTAKPGHLIVAADYKFIELRTLAHVMEEMFGKSVLADVIREGVDPHEYTAALLTNTDFERFKQMKTTNSKFYKKWRQDAKICFSGDTEILTDKGWCKFEEYNGTDKVAQYSLPNNITTNTNTKWEGTEGIIEFIEPEQFKSFDEQEVFHQEDANVDMLLTGNHNILYIDKNEEVCQKSAIDVSNVKYLISGGKYDNNSELNDTETRLLAIILSDGNFEWQNGIKIIFDENDKEEILRCKELIYKANIQPYYVNCFGTVEIYIYGREFRNKILKYISKDNTLYWDCIHTLNGKIFIDEILHYYKDSSNKQNIDIIQALSTLNSYQSVIVNNFIYINYNSPTARIYWDLQQTDTKLKVYCVKVPSGYILIRRNGKVVITPNCNFGLPGGLSAYSLVHYAKCIYGVDLTFEQANNYRNKLLNEVYPELGKYLESDDMVLLASNLGTSVEKCWEKFDWSKTKEPYVTLPIKNIISGNATKRDGTPYNPEFVSKIWKGLLELNQNETIELQLKNREPSLQLMRILFWDNVKTTTGRIRGKVSFTQGKNTPFQGLAIDGAKRAIWRLTRLGYNVLFLIHDEIGVEIKDLGGYASLDTVKDICRIMCEEMRYVTGKVPVDVDFVVNKKWKKDGKIKIEGDRVYPGE